MSLTIEQVRALAPDEASFKAGRGLANPRQWPLLGQAPDEALWGECQGSGAKPYQTQVDLRDSQQVARCTCPSRKLPCKHALALLVLWAQQGATLPTAAPPTWVSEWLAARSERSEKKKAKAEERAVDSVEQLERLAEREAKRLTQARDACAMLERWLEDGIDRGLVSVRDDAAEVLNMAARMVDAQLPGLAMRLRELHQSLLSGTHWVDAALARMGLLALACSALRRREALSPALRAELDSALGWTVDREQLLVRGDVLEDDWTVLGVRQVETERLTERRVWLYGAQQQRYAYLLDFRFGQSPFASAYAVDQAFRGALHRYPGQGGLRVAQLQAPDGPAQAQKPGFALARSLELLAELGARTPWQWWQPLWLGQAHLHQRDGGWGLVCEGHWIALQIADEQALVLYAMSAGQVAGPLRRALGRAGGAAGRAHRRRSLEHPRWLSSRVDCDAWPQSGRRTASASGRRWPNHGRHWARSGPKG